MEVFAVYPGRFHPLHRGHASSFNQLADKFGIEKTLLAISGKQEPPKSPFSVGDRAKMAIACGIPKENVISVAQPYKAEEYIKYLEDRGLDPQNYALVFGVSKKDMEGVPEMGIPPDPRFTFKPKRDGSPAYLQPYSGNEGDLKNMLQHAYVYSTDVEEFPIAGQTLRDASAIRSAYRSGDEKTRHQILHDMYGGKAAKHLKRVFDAALLSSETLGEFYGRVKPLLAEASIAKRMEVLKRLLERKRKRGGRRSGRRGLKLGRSITTGWWGGLGNDSGEGGGDGGGMAEGFLNENVTELYHGTLAKNVDSILANGLNPTVGEFTRSIYANKAKPLVFAADASGSRGVYCALVGQMHAKLGITAYPPSAEDVAKHCAILVISKDVGKFRQYNSTRRQGSKEPTDYTSEQTIRIDKVLTGKDLLQWIKTHGADRGEMCSIDNQQSVAEGSNYEREPLYHATLKAFEPSIMKSGLLPGGNLRMFDWSDSKYVYLSNYPDIARDFIDPGVIEPNQEHEEQIFDLMKQGGVILKIDQNKLNRKLLSADPHFNTDADDGAETYIYSGVIPPSAIIGKQYFNINESKQGVAEASSPAQQAAIAINMKKAGKKPKKVDETVVDYLEETTTK